MRVVSACSRVDGVLYWRPLEFSVVPTEEAVILYHICVDIIFVCTVELEGIVG